VIECDPAARVEVMNVAVPLLSVPPPIALPPSMNVTVPVAVLGVTLAVNVTALPKIEGSGLELTEIEEVAWLTLSVTLAVVVL
jgi:hypothetical protein